MCYPVAYLLSRVSQAPRTSSREGRQPWDLQSTRSWTKDVLLELRRQTRSEYLGEARTNKNKYIYIYIYIYTSISNKGKQHNIINNKPTNQQQHKQFLDEGRSQPSSRASTPRRHVPPAQRSARSAPPSRLPSARSRSPREPEQSGLSWAQHCRALRGLFARRHGSLQAAFVALDSDGDGRVGPGDIVGELRCDSGVGRQLLSVRTAAQLARELDREWNGCAEPAAFLATFGWPGDCVLPAKADLVCGEVAEIGYCCHLECFPELAARHRRRESLPTYFFLGLVPRATGEAQPIIRQYLESASGTVRLEVPAVAPGSYEWQLFGGTAKGETPLGARVPCRVLGAGALAAPRGHSTV